MRNAIGPAASRAAAFLLTLALVVAGLAAGGSVLSQPTPGAPPAAPPRADAFIGSPRMSVDRNEHATFALSDGRAVVAGGTASAGDEGVILATCEVLDARTRTWSPYPSLPVPISLAFCATLPDDILLVAGGLAEVAPGVAVPSDRAFISDAGRGSHEWVEIDPLPFPLAIVHDLTHNTLSLPDGTFLLVSGFSLDSANDLSFIFTPDRAHPRRGTFDLTRDRTKPRVPVRSGRGGSITLAPVNPDEPDSPKIAMLRDEAGRFRPEHRGQPLEIAGSAAGNDSPGGRGFFVYKVLSPQAILYWNPDARREPAFGGTWTVGGRRPETRCSPRYGTVPVRLPDGRVVRVGGVDRFDEPARADWEIYDPRTGRWTLYDAPDQLIPPVHGEVTQEGDGDRIDGRRGGRAVLKDRGASFSEADRFRWITIEGAASAANNGTFFIDGSRDAHTITYENEAAVAERFDGCWTIRDGEDPITARSSGRDHTPAAALPDGRVLVAGGRTSFGFPPGVLRRSCFILDPDRPDRPWRRTASKPVRRHYAKPFPLPGGAIGLTLGFDTMVEEDGTDCAGIAHASTEIFDPATETWSFGVPAPTEPVDRDGLLCDLPVTDNNFGFATPLATGEILFTGGFDPRDPDFPGSSATLLYVPGRAAGD